MMKVNDFFQPSYNIVVLSNERTKETKFVLRS